MPSRDVADFGPAIATVLSHEGGYVDHPDDPGGETNFGLTKRDHPDLDIRALTRTQAAEVYRVRWWDGRGFDQIADQQVANKLFDMTVNLGFRTAVRALQRALNYLARKPFEVDADGLLGPRTIALANAVKPDLLVLTLRAYHALRYVELVEGPDARFETFAEGWLKRAFS